MKKFILKKGLKQIAIYSTISFVVFVAMMFGTYKFIGHAIGNFTSDGEEGNAMLAQAVGNNGSTVKESEMEQVHDFVSASHDRWNLLLCYGKWEHYKFDDLRRNMLIYEAEFDEIFSKVKDERIKVDIENARTLLKIALKEKNRTALKYVHRIFHDLDISYNGYQQKGFGGYSTLANGKNATQVLSFISNHN